MSFSAIRKMDRRFTNACFGASFHLPTEPVFLLFGIDQLMHMARSGVNVLGNCLAAVVIAKWEEEESEFEGEKV